MSDMPSGDVNVKLINLEPTGTTRATFNDRVYTFKPESKNVELTFKVIEGGDPVSAELSADYFEAVDPVSLDPWTGITIQKQKISVGNYDMKKNTTYTFELYTQNPGTSSSVNTTDKFGEFTAERNSTNKEAITITDYTTYQNLIDDNIIYVRFKGNNGNYHVATADFSNLSNGNSVSLKWLY